MKVSLPLLYLLPIFLILIFSFIFFSGQIIFTEIINNKAKLLLGKVQNTKGLSDTSFQLGQMYLQRKNYALALNELYLSLQIWNSNDKIGLASLYNTLGVIYFKLKNYDFAIYYYEQAIKLFPAYLTALNNLAFLHEEMKNNTKARKLYIQIWKLDRTNKVAARKAKAFT